MVVNGILMENTMENMMFYGMGGLLMTIFWAVVFVGGGYLIYTFPKNRGYGHEDSAERLIRERFARGELTKEEYRQKIKTLRNE
jgi:putative membrane protein